MRNYFRKLNIPTTASDAELENALVTDSESTHAIDSRQLEDARAILMDNERLQLYRNLVQLYERMGSASSCLESFPATDSHRWHDRLAEFKVMDDIADL